MVDIWRATAVVVEPHRHFTACRWHIRKPGYPLDLWSEHIQDGTINLTFLHTRVGFGVYHRNVTVKIDRCC